LGYKKSESRFVIGEKKRKRARTKTPRKDSISDVEVMLYRKAIERKGNDWKQILEYFVRHNDLLEQNIALKYKTAWENIDDKEAVKCVRNRLGNIGRRAKHSPEVTEREERCIVDDASTAEQVVLQMKNIKGAEARDPLNDVHCDESDKSEAADDAAVQVLSRKQAEPSCSKSKRGEAAPVILEFSDSVSSESSLDQQPRPPKRKRKKGSKKAYRKREKGLPNRLKNMTNRAENLMAVGLQTAKLHMKYLKESARNQGIDLESSGSDATE